MPAWCRADLLKRVGSALAFTRLALERAIAQDRSPPEDEAPAETGTVRPLMLAKVSAEAAMLVRCAAQVPEPDTALRSALDDLAHLLAPQARADAVKVALCRSTDRPIVQASAHVLLQHAGYGDDAFSAFLADLLAIDPCRGTELLPNQLLECDWLERLGSDAPADRDLLARTCLAQPMDAFHASTFDWYAFTHVILYASDMGRRAAALPRPVAEIMQDAETGLAASLDADKFDLAAELLWSWPMLGQPWSPAANFSFQVLAAVVAAFGFLPGPQFPLRSQATESGAPTTDFALRTSYHTTLVFGMLCAVTLLPGRAPSSPEVARPDAQPVPAGPPIDLLRPAPDRRWRETWDRLDATERAPLADFVMSLALRRAVAANDLDHMRHCLERALSLDLADGPAIRQAVAILRKATLLGRSVAMTCPADG